MLSLVSEIVDIFAFLLDLIGVLILTAQILPVAHHKEKSAIQTSPATKVSFHRFNLACLQYLHGCLGLSH